MASLAPRFVPPRSPAERPGPSGGKRHQNRIARTQDLCESALRAFLQYGVDTVTIDLIASGADMSKGSFYRYFRNKSDLVHTLLEPISEPTIEALDRAVERLQRAETPRELRGAYSTLTVELVSELNRHLDLVRLYLQERRGPRTPDRAPIVDLEARIAERTMQATMAARKHALLREVDPRVSATAVRGAVTELLWQQLEGDGIADPLSAANQLIDIVLHGVQAA